MASIHTKVINLQGIFPAKSLSFFTDNLLFPWVFHLKFNEVDLHQLSSMTAVDASKRFLKWKQWKYQRVFCHIPLSSVTQLRAMIHSVQKNDTKKRETGKTESTNLKEREISRKLANWKLLSVFSVELISLPQWRLIMRKVADAKMVCSGLENPKTQEGEVESSTFLLSVAIKQ